MNFLFNMTPPPNTGYLCNQRPECEAGAGVANQLKLAFNSSHQ